MKRCPRCQTNYTDEVRWCPADGTPTEGLAPVSPAALAAVAIDDIPEGSPTMKGNDSGVGSGGEVGRRRGGW